MNKKCYHMTKHIKEIIEEKTLKPLVGENSKYVNDVKSENLGISYSLGLEGIIATNAMFCARYQYNLLENESDKVITLDDMFAQDVQKQLDTSLGSNVYLVFDENENIKNDNKHRDIADPKTKSSIGLEHIRGVVLRNVETQQIKYDVNSIVMYAISKANIDNILERLINSDRPFMNMEGYAKTNFSFKEYVIKYYETKLKEFSMSEIVDGKYELEEINIKQLMRIIDTERAMYSKEDLLQSYQKAELSLSDLNNAYAVISKTKQEKEHNKTKDIEER